MHKIKDLLRYLVKTNYFIGLLILFLTWGVYFLLIWPKMMFWTNQGISSGWIGVWDDWAAHSTYASTIAFRPLNDWFISNPLFYGNKWAYPFAADAISGLMIKSGFDFVAAFIIPSIILSFLLLAALYSFYHYLTKSARQSYLAITLLLANGGAGFIWFLRDWLKAPYLSTLLSPPQEYTHLRPVGIEWINIVTAELLPQRAYLLGLPVALGLLLLLLHQRKKEFTLLRQIAIGLVGLTSGLMLIIHVHSYIALAIVCLCLFISDLISDRKHTFFWITFGFGAIIGSGIIYHLFLQGGINGSFFRFYPGWMANKDAYNMNYLIFLLRNWGLAVFLIPLSIWQTKTYKQPLVIAGIALFLIANLFILQPFNWDNTKILTWSYLLLVWPMAIWLDKLWQGNLIKKFIVGCCVVLLTFSGFLDIIYLSDTNKHTYQMWSNEEIALASQLRRISQPTDVILTSDYHIHWAANLTGRSVLLGYRGWLWTYGIDYGAREKDVSAMFAGGSKAVSLLKKYNVRYVVIGDHERSDWHANEDFFDATYPIIEQLAGYKVYKVQ